MGNPNGIKYLYTSQYNLKFDLFMAYGDGIGYDENDIKLKKPVISKLKKLKTDHIVGILLYFTNKLIINDGSPDTIFSSISSDWKATHLILLEELKFRKIK